MCVSVIEFGMEGQEIRCFSQKKVRELSTMLNILAAAVSLSCHSSMRWVMKVLN